MTADRRLGQSQCAGGARQRSFGQHRQEGAVEIPVWFVRSHTKLYSHYAVFGNFLLARFGRHSLHQLTKRRTSWKKQHWYWAQPAALAAKWHVFWWRAVGM